MSNDVCYNPTCCHNLRNRDREKFSKLTAISRLHFVARYMPDAQVKAGYVQMGQLNIFDALRVVNLS